MYKKNTPSLMQHITILKKYMYKVEMSMDMHEYG